MSSPPPNDLRVAVAGAGFFARFHLDAWQRIPGARLVAVCDHDPSARAWANAALPQVSVFADVATMLDTVGVDLLDVATPPATHLALVGEAAARGLPVISQKPLAPTRAQAEAVVAVAAQAGVTLVVHENIRFAPWHQEMGRLIETGHLGRLHGITMRLRPGDGQGPQAYLARQPYFQGMERFLIHETGIHWIDTFRYLMGEVTGVFARLRRLNPAIAGEDAGRVLFAFEGGADGLFDANRLNDHESDNPRRTMGEMWLEGEAGVLRLDGAGALWWKPHGAPELAHPYPWTDRSFAGDAVHATQTHIVRALRAGSSPANEGHAYLRNLDVEEAVYRSAREGRWIDV